MRNKGYKFIRFAFLTILLLSMAFAAGAQNRSNRGAAETITGTAVLYPTGFNTRMISLPFTLRLTGETSAEDASNLLGTLQESGQDDVLRQIRNRDLGSFTLGGRIGPRINFVKEDMINGQRRLFVAFERWMQFAEVRGGYRSTNYPFGVLEIYIDPRTGKGSGTYIPAAQVRWRTDKRSGQGQVEIENFATFPGRLMGVQSSRRG